MGAASIVQQLHPELQSQAEYLQRWGGCQLRRLPGCSPPTQAGWLDRFLLEIPFAFEILRWQVVFHQLSTGWAPDLVLPEEYWGSTSAEALAATLGQVASLLAGWDVSQPEQLQQLAKFLLDRYQDVQRQHVQTIAAQDQRLQFELDTLPAESVTHMLVTQKGDDRQVVFVFSLPGIQLSSLQSFLPHLQASHVPSAAQAVAKLEREFRVKVSYRLVDGKTAAKPDVTIHMPAAVQDLVGIPRQPPPAWSSSTCLMEYVPQVAEHLQQHLSSVAAAAAARRDLLAALAASLGAPLQQDGATFRHATYEASQEGIPYRMVIQLPASFPEGRPDIMLQNERSGQEVARPGPDLPYSPRWQPADIVAHIVAYLAETVPTLVSKLL